MNTTPAAERLHIGIFGKRNAGKSTLINAMTDQDLAIVSDVKGTTTDPVIKSMELLPLGPVVIIDTPGIDDEGELGALRVKKSYQVLNKCDIAILVVNNKTGLEEPENKLIKKFLDKEIPYLLVYNCFEYEKEETPIVHSIDGRLLDISKSLHEKIAALNENLPADKKPHTIYVQALLKDFIYELKEKLSKIIPSTKSELKIVADLINPSDFVVLVVPIDKAAPKGRLILPQQQTIRDILEADATAVVCKEYELRETLESLGKKPKIVITDSQVFSKVNADTPKDILLTSFSILFARYKGNLETVVKGVTALENLKDGDKILMGEGCTHHRQCDDIGTVKIPRWILNYTGKNLQFDFTSGTGWPDDLSEYKMIIHCGGCMITEREMKYRMACAKDQNIPFTNYGITIAYMQNILKRSVEAFPFIYACLDEY
ncbi:[FeFe] hydrogenase H-cluster maturation GTPase HydF [Acetitomaculum ruminis DSM 5522]|uniref:[FeFe] hydrogenase H-cluster maturation GTPase HydF n=1 Tax=Acetitomaculum ruminis DSM 5522 TaxID=1120918 RepID=A0A1I0ZB70_9FIRM|nr:[FeFe] hydrogenase H-cluster maturation GTPase HydF [Acetitomaculum ruminis]SFB21658.1 [FeFe] hydrogenase H-cluster maturation GTPase HydF [Acetitomaculum ruminis DSM 5522]